MSELDPVLADILNASEFEVQLRAVVGDDVQAREDVRQMAIELVKCGISAEDIPVLIRRAQSGPIMTVFELMKLRHGLVGYVDGAIDAIKHREGMTDV